ncbi:hypothetical protein GCM10011319_40500 [Mameliella alba]|nr:hypothetical protein GCM10011319_40500 [Mameliella alba]
MTGFYLADLASGPGPCPVLSVSTIDRRLSGLSWNYTQRGFTLDRKNWHIATLLAGIKRRQTRPPVQKAAILAEYILAMVATLSSACTGQGGCTISGSARVLSLNVAPVTEFRRVMGGVPTTTLCGWLNGRWSMPASVPSLRYR